MSRITGRRSCPECGRVYHTEYLKPKNDGICDDCAGVTLVQRADDTEEVVRDRLKAYYVQTEPVIEYYRKSGQVKVVEVDGNGTPDSVTGVLVEAVGGLT